MRRGFVGCVLEVVMGPPIRSALSPRLADSPNDLPDSVHVRRFAPRGEKLGYSSIMEALIEEACRHLPPQPRGPARIVRPMDGLALLRQHTKSPIEASLYRPVLCL